MADARDAVEAVAARDDFAHQLARFAVGAAIADARSLAADVVDRDVLDLELERQPPPQPIRDHVLHDLGLRVDGDAAPGERAEVEAMALAGELEIDASVREALGVEPLAQAHGAQQSDDVVLEQPGALALLAVSARARLEDHRIDPSARQQMAQHEASRTRAHDAHARARGLHASFSSAPSVCTATWNAWLAAGTPQ